MVTASQRTRVGGSWTETAKRDSAGGRTADILPVERIETLAGLFRARVERTPGVNAYHYFDPRRQAWSSLTWWRMARQTARWQAALVREGFQPGDRVAIMLRNCPEWVMLDQAALGLGLVVVPLYTNDRPDNTAYILDHCGAGLLLIDGPDQWQALRSVCRDLPALRRIVSLQPVGGGEGDARLCHCEAWLPEVTAQEPLLERGSGDGLATIVYTSGTTGRPKGVMLSHRNVLWNARSALDTVMVYPEDTFLSFLPLSHALERTIGYYLAMMAGASVAYNRAISVLAEDLTEVRPTVLISVPRIFERVFAKVQLQLEERSRFSRLVFHAAVDAGWTAFEFQQGRRERPPSRLRHKVLDRLVADKVRARLGGRLRVAVCGGAPLPPQVGRLFIGLGVPIIQGYGLTEASPVVSANALSHNDPASVGSPLRDVRVRLGKDRELLVKSPGVMLGYWKDPVASAAVIDTEGWLHSGDTAEIRDGLIYITGRLKEIIVLSNGEKIPYGDMEMAIVQDPLFEQAMVVGEGRPYLGALVVVDQVQWSRWMQQLGCDPADSTAVEDKVVLQKAIDRISLRLHDFPGYAQIRRIAVFFEPWTVENGLLTPTMKLRRREIVSRYDACVTKLYEGH